MNIDNKVCVISNYATKDLAECLKVYGKEGYKLVSTEMVKNKHDVEVIYLFFTKEE